MYFTCSYLLLPKGVVCDMYGLVRLRFNLYPLTMDLRDRSDVLEKTGRREGGNVGRWSAEMCSLCFCGIISRSLSVYFHNSCRLSGLSLLRGNAMQTFACDNLEEIEKWYLRADYRISCDADRHKAFQIYAGVMILVRRLDSCWYQALHERKPTPLYQEPAVRVYQHLCVVCVFVVVFLVYIPLPNLFCLPPASPLLTQQSHPVCFSVYVASTFWFT